MSKIMRVTLEFDDVIKIAEGSEAERFEKNLHEIITFANEQGQNSFANDKINWRNYPAYKPDTKK